MPDDLDRAAELQQLSNERALALHAGRPVAVARTHCADCGELIAPARAALKVSCCLGCQQARERGR